MNFVLSSVSHPAHSFVVNIGKDNKRRHLHRGTPFDIIKWEASDEASHLLTQKLLSGMTAFYCPTESTSKKSARQNLRMHMHISIIIVPAANLCMMLSPSKFIFIVGIIARHSYLVNRETENF